MEMKTKLQGFTLIEILLVMVVVSSLIYMGIGYLQQRTEYTRIDRTALQMQQLLNGALSYYVANGQWPANFACLQGTGGAACTVQYVTPTLTNSPFNTTYCGSTFGTPNFYFATQISAGSLATAQADANILAGRLPLAYVTSTNPCTAVTPPPPSACTGGAVVSGVSSNPNCYVVSMVNIPGQNLNNASAITFAGLYHNGGCIPVPTCPVDASGKTMTPEVFIVPVSVSGVNDVGTNNSNVYPISSFTAYATGTPTGGTNPPLCGTTSDTGSGAAATNCAFKSGDKVNGMPASNDLKTSANYWRACLQVVTEKGNVASTSSSASPNLWGQFVTLAAFTRCSITNEPSGSTFNVFGN